MNNPDRNEVALRMATLATQGQHPEIARLITESVREEEKPLARVLDTAVEAVTTFLSNDKKTSVVVFSRNHNHGIYADVATEESAVLDALGVRRTAGSVDTTWRTGFQGVVVTERASRTGTQLELRRVPQS